MSRSLAFEDDSGVRDLMANIVPRKLSPIEYIFYGDSSLCYWGGCLCPIPMPRVAKYECNKFSGGLNYETEHEIMLCSANDGEIGREGKKEGWKCNTLPHELGSLSIATQFTW